MNGQHLAQELDPNPFVTTLLDKTKAGKLNWQPTASENTFIASVGGETTLKIALEAVENFDVYGQPEMTQVPLLCLIDSEGRKLWEISSSQVNGGLWRLYSLAQRIANKIDERMAALLEVLQKL